MKGAVQSRTGKGKENVEAGKGKLEEYAVESVQVHQGRKRGGIAYVEA